MNYIKLINDFWQVRRERPDFDPYVITLYFVLLDMANRNSWNSFTAYREDITTLASMSHNSYYKARKTLKDAGLVEFVDGANKLSKCCFTVLAVSFPGTQLNTQQGHNVIHNKDTTRTQRDTILDKPINNKTLNLKPKTGNTPEGDSIDFVVRSISAIENDTLTAKEKKAAHTGGAAPARIEPEPDLHFPFDTPNFRDTWRVWNEYRKGKKIAYKNILSEQAALKQLSRFDETFAIELIERSMGNGWQGLIFEKTAQEFQNYLKNQNNGRNNQGNGNRLDVEEAVRLARLLA